MQNDFYTALAAEVLKKPYDQITAQERERAKAYWYARLYDPATNMRYVNRFTFLSIDEASQFMGTVSLDTMPEQDDAGLTLVYYFNNPHDAYVSLCEANSSGIHIVVTSCNSEVPK